MHLRPPASTTSVPDLAWPVELRVTGAVLALSVVLWWLASPYAGIRHDAVFYAADALRRLQPASLGHDLFFHRLSQGDFSWYGIAYAAAIRWFGLDSAAWGITLASRLAWCMALWGWCQTATAGRSSGALLAGLLCLPAGYGALVALYVAEPFATPRVLTESLVLLALTLAWRGRPLLAWLTVALALATHPLMALGGAAVLAWMLPAHIRTAVVIAAGLGLSALVSAGIEPFHRLVQFYDPAWWLVVERQNPMTVFSHWTASDMAHLVVALLLLADAARLSPAGTVPRRLATGLGLITVLSVLAWAWATEVRQVLVIQLQVWRVLWLVQVLAPGLWLAAWCRGDMPRPSASATVLMVVAWCSDAVAAPVLASLALWLIHSTAAHVHPAVRRWAPILATAMALLFLVSRIQPLMQDPGLAVVALAPEQSVARVLREPLVALLLVGAATAWAGRHATTMRQPGAKRPAHRAAALALATTTLVAWSAWMFRPSSEAAPPSLAAAADLAIRPGDTVWAEAGLPWTWLRLRRAQWVSQEQCAGALFSRDAALTWQVRWTVLTSLGLTGEVQRPHAGTSQTVAALCAQPGLDVLLLNGGQPGADRVLTAADTRARLSLFDCRQRRGGT